MKHDNAKRAAAVIAEAWQMGQLIDRLPDEIRPTSIAEGYCVQDLLAAELDMPIAGWKVGATGPIARKLLKARAPFCGRVFAGRVFGSGASVPSNAYPLRALEAEFCFRLAKPLPERAKPYRLADVRAAVGEVIPAIEIVAPRWRAMGEVGLPSLIADLGLNAALVLGTKLRGGATLDLKKIPVRMEVDGKIVGQGTGADVLGDPYLSLLWLANRLRTRGGLAAGQLISTGTCTGLFKAEPGAKAQAWFNNKQAVALNFV